METETIDTINRIVNGTVVALPICLIIIVVLWKHLEKKDQKLEALSNSVIKAHTENLKVTEQNTQQSKDTQKSMEANTKATESLALKIDYIFRNGNTKNT